MDARPLTPVRSRWSYFAVALCVVGCKSSPKYDLIEAELRARNQELAQARTELEYLRGVNHVNQSLRSESARGEVPVLPLKEIALASGTGGINADGHDGDEALQIVLVPKDDDGTAMKIPGRVTIFAYEIARGGVKTPIGRWDVPAEELRKYWRSGLLATGHYLVVQWDKPPGTERLRIAVRMTTLDGRVYETDRDVPVKPLAGLVERPAVRIGAITPQ